MKIRTAILILPISLMLLTQAQALCKCECLGGVMQPKCTSQMDLRPLCPTLCPIPPVVSRQFGEKSCTKVRKCDEMGRCYWEEECEKW
jgi:hypothetical protein